jgi:hypothetical protein
MQALCATLHIWTQIVGKVRFALSPYVTPLVAYAALCDRARSYDVAHLL